MKTEGKYNSTNKVKKAKNEEGKKQGAETADNRKNTLASSMEDKGKGKRKKGKGRIIHH